MPCFMGDTAQRSFMKPRDKKQFNVRLGKGLPEAIDSVCDKLAFGKDEFVEVAVRSLFGTQDEVIRAKGKMVKRMARELDLPFETPDGQSIGLAA